MRLQYLETANVDFNLGRDFLVDLWMGTASEPSGDKYQSPWQKSFGIVFRQFLSEDDLKNRHLFLPLALIVATKSRNCYTGAKTGPFLLAAANDRGLNDLAGNSGLINTRNP